MTKSLIVGIVDSNHMYAIFISYIPSSTLVGNTQIKLTLREYNLRCYNRRLNL